MPYLIDGNNLIGAERGGRASQDDRTALVRELSDRLRRTRARVVVFFDGAGDPLSLGSLSVKFAGTKTADDAILRELGRSARPQEVTVVTADRELARRARDAGGTTISPADLWKRFGTGDAPAPVRPHPMRVDVEAWLEWFSDERNRKE
jgi:predicted RNA-binding protein with PIN domain